MLTPLGNPQNLYLYGKSGLSFGRFLLLMLPYTLTALALLCIWSFWLCVKEKKKVIQMEWKSEEQVFCNWKKIRVYLILFGICLLAVLHIMDYRISFLIVLLLIFLWGQKKFETSRLFVITYVCCIFYLYWKCRKNFCFFTMAKSDYRRTGGNCGSACKSDYQQCSDCTFIIRIYQ